MLPILRSSLPLMRNFASQFAKRHSNILKSKVASSPNAIVSFHCGIPLSKDSVPVKPAGNESLTLPETDSATARLSEISPKLLLEFTCTVCDTRNKKQMSKLAYQKGVVIIKCDGCSNNHLIADNLGWFSGDTKKRINIEDLMAEKGETVRRVSDEAQTWELVTDTVAQMKSEEK